MGVSKYFNDVGCKHHLLNLLHERVSSIWPLFWNESGPQSCNSIEASEIWVQAYRKRLYHNKLCQPFLHTQSQQIMVKWIILNFYNWLRCNINSYINIHYYNSFKIFPRFWLAKSTSIIHHNQSLMTKFGRILCLTRKWRQKRSILAG